MLVALGSVLAWRQYDDAKQSELNDLRARVVLGGIVFDTYFAGQVKALDALASSPTVTSGDTAAMAKYFKRMQPSNEQLRLFNAGIGWIDAQGNSRVSSTRPHGSDVNVSDRDYFKQVMATGRPYISNGLTSRLAKRQVVVVAVPTRDASGKLTGRARRRARAHAVRPARIPRRRRSGSSDLVLLDREGQQLTLPTFAPAENTALVREISSGAGREVRRRRA